MVDYAAYEAAVPKSEAPAGPGTSHGAAGPSSRSTPSTQASQQAIIDTQKHMITKLKARMRMLYAAGAGAERGEASDTSRMAPSLAAVGETTAAAAAAAAARRQLGLVSASPSIPQEPSRPNIRRAPSELQAQINSHIATSTKHARLDFLDQTGSFESHSLGILINGTRRRPTKVFLDLGATICLIGYSAAVAMNLDIWETSVLLATSTISAQRVLGVTSPLTLQFGLPPNHINFETVLLVTQEMDRVYDLLLSNQVSHAFKGVVNHDIPSTFTLTRPADGAQIVMPLRPSF